jgi:hypothetical protein
MGYLAFDAIDDAIDATTAFLTPIDRSRWLRLLIVVFFIGGGGVNVPTSGGWPSDGGSGPSASALDQGTIAVIVGVIAVVLLLVLTLAVIGAIMQFVLIESLRSETVHVRRYVRRHWRRGLRLFGFRIGLLLLVALLIGLPVAVGVLGILGGAGASEVAFASVGLLFVLLPIGLVLFAGLALVNGLTTTFVVPTMLAEDCGVIAAWRRFWRPLRAEWREYAVYVVVNWLLHAGAGIAAALVGLLAMVVVTIPLATAALLVALGTGASVSPPTIAVYVLLGLTWLLLVILIGLLIRIPVVTFFRYYALLILGDTDPALDLIPEQRAAVRSGDGDATPG